MTNLSCRWGWRSSYEPSSKSENIWDTLFKTWQTSKQTWLSLVISLGQNGIYLELKVGNFQLKAKKMGNTWRVRRVCQEKTQHILAVFLTKIKKSLNCEPSSKSDALFKTWQTSKQTWLSLVISPGQNGIYLELKVGHFQLKSIEMGNTWRIRRKLNISWPYFCDQNKKDLKSWFTYKIG
jgi:hypothetical protein